MAKINMTLLNNQKEVLNYKNIDAEYTKNHIIFEDTYGRHVINRNKKTYERIGPKDEFTVNFMKNTCIISFNGKKLEYDIKTDYIDLQDQLKLTYIIGDEEKIMIITKGEEL